MVLSNAITVAKMLPSKDERKTFKPTHGYVYDSWTAREHISEVKTLIDIYPILYRFDQSQFLTS